MSTKHGKVQCTSQGEIKLSRPSKKEEGHPSTPKKQLPVTSLTPEPKIPLNNSKTKKPDKIPPAPPTNLIVGPSSLKGLEELEEILRSLNNAQLLKSASLLSLTTMKQIADWTQERQRMFVANYSFEKKNEIRKAKELSNDDQDIWINFLTLENIKTLQKSNLPTIENWENVQKPYSLFKIPLIQVELNLGLATTLIEFAIFISVAYFWIFLREGKNISGPLAPGTLLSAVRRDRFSFSLFVLFALIPIVASLGLAFSSRHAAKIFFVSLDWVFANSTFLFSSLVVWELLMAKKENNMMEGIEVVKSRHHLI